MDRGAWQATLHGEAESDTSEQLSLSFMMKVTAFILYTLLFLIYTASWLVCLLYRQISVLDLSLFCCVYKNTQDESSLHKDTISTVDRIPHIVHFTPVTHSFCTWKFVLLS